MGTDRGRYGDRPNQTVPLAAPVCTEQIGLGALVEAAGHQQRSQLGSCAGSEVTAATGPPGASSQTLGSPSRPLFGAQLLPKREPDSGGPMPTRTDAAAWSTWMRDRSDREEERVTPEMPETLY